MNINDGTAVFAVRNLQLQALVDFLYPVGIIAEFANDADPNTIWSGTTWEKMEAGRVLISSGKGRDKNGEEITFTTGQEDTVGEYTHNLTIDEMPAHSHSGTASANGDHNHTLKRAGNSDQSNVDSGANSPIADIVTSTNGSHTHNVAIENTGGDNAHNNLPPFSVVSRWKRTA